MLSALPVGEVAQRSFFRLQALAREPSEALIRMLRHSQPRWETHVWRVLPADLDRLSDNPDLVQTGLTADVPGIDIRYDRVRDGLDAYVDRRELHRLEQQLHPIVDADEPNLWLRVPLHTDWILDHEVAPVPVVAADLIDHDDPRVRRAAETALKALRGG